MCVVAPYGRLMDGNFSRFICTLMFSVICRSIIWIRILLNHLVRSSSIGQFINNAQYRGDRPTSIV